MTKKDGSSTYLSLSRLTSIVEKSLLADDADKRQKALINAYNSLNDTGQSKAIEQVELLTRIPEYRKDSNNTKLNAAHARTDIDIPEGTDTSNDAIMDDENF